jgi:hypothetical protein
MNPNPPYDKPNPVPGAHLPSGFGIAEDKLHSTAKFDYNGTEYEITHGS